MRLARAAAAVTAGPAAAAVGATACPPASARNAATTAAASLGVAAAAGGARGSVRSLSSAAASRSSSVVFASTAPNSAASSSSSFSSSSAACASTSSPEPPRLWPLTRDLPEVFGGSAAADGVVGPAPPARAIVVVNAPQMPASLAALWASPRSLRVCADGGANEVARLRRKQVQSGDAVASLSSSPPLPVPDAVVGDLDSFVNAADASSPDHIPADRVFRVVDDDTTDLEKVLDFLHQGVLDEVFTSRLRAEDGLAEVDAQVEGVQDMPIVVCGGGGNLSQELGNINALVRDGGRNHSRRLYLLTGENLFVLLPAGEHVLDLSLASETTQGRGNDAAAGAEEQEQQQHASLRREDGVHAALLPFLPVRSVTTSGLMWNLNDDPLAFGGMVSTSNALTASQVRLTLSDPVIFGLDFRTR